MTEQLTLALSLVFCGLPGSLVLRLHVPTAVGMGLIPGQETKSHMPHDASESREEKSMHVKVVVPSLLHASLCPGGSVESEAQRVYKLLTIPTVQAAPSCLVPPVSPLLSFQWPFQPV